MLYIYWWSALLGQEYNCPFLLLNLILLIVLIVFVVLIVFECVDCASCVNCVYFIHCIYCVLSWIKNFVTFFLGEQCLLDSLVLISNFALHLILYFLSRTRYWRFSLDFFKAKVLLMFWLLFWQCVVLTLCCFCSVLLTVRGCDSVLLLLCLLC